MKFFHFISATILASAAHAAPAQQRAGGVQLGGVNIAGFDFGCTTDGTCDTSRVYPASNYADQMNHFVQNDNLNVFRLPVGWQYLVNNRQDGDLDYTNFGTYDQEVQACLATGASCIIDIHNYARWNGAIIGQGGPGNENLAKTWAQIATKYASNDRIVFGVMNEPHDVDIRAWGATVQAVVNAIRTSGATSQIILLPGNDYTSATKFIINQSLDILKALTNPDGSTDGLVFDVHSYLDVDSSGTHTECVTDHILDSFAPLADALRDMGRKAMLSETGGGNTASCQQYLCNLIQFLK
jgi:endoglucanase